MSICYIYLIHIIFQYVTKHLNIDFSFIRTMNEELIMYINKNTVLKQLTNAKIGKIKQSCVFDQKLNRKIDTM